MVDFWVGFGGIVGVVEWSWGPVVAKLSLKFTTAEPPKTHIHGLHLFGDNGFVCNPRAVVLSVWMGDLGWGHPISSRDCRSGTISLAQMYSPASSASAAEEATNLMIWARVMMGPLCGGTGTSSDTMMCAPARLRALLTLYERLFLR